jgi:hypothetical protein
MVADERERNVTLCCLSKVLFDRGMISGLIRDSKILTVCILAEYFFFRFWIGTDI